MLQHQNEFEHSRLKSVAKNRLRGRRWSSRVQHFGSHQSEFEHSRLMSVAKIGYGDAGGRFASASERV